MFTDFRESAAPEQLDCDVCVVGAGAAGISIALRLANSRLRVCVVESGGFEADPAVQSLYEGESVGNQLADPMACRLRYFGGTTNHWQGWCAPLDAGDFEARSWVPHSGWPISKRDLDPYYQAALQIVELNAYRYEMGQFPIEDRDLPPFDPRKLRVRYWQYSPPTRFGSRYRDALRRATNVEVILNANTVKIETDATATRVEAIHLRTLTGRAGIVRARSFVLACGGMENARLLLATRDTEPKGLGTGSDALGRFFLQHPEAPVAQVVTDWPASLVRAFNLRKSDVGSIRAHITCAAPLQKQFRLLNAGFDILVRRDFGAGYAALRETRTDIGHGQWPSNLDEKLWAVLSDLDGVAGGLYKSARGMVSSLDLVAHAEQTPNPESRLTLTNERDVLGIRKLKVDWRLTRDDKRSMLESTLRVGEELARLKLGRIKIEEWLLAGEEAWPNPIWSGCHHMGTTRMSDDPSSGVVDRNCRMHGVANLYVAGSSVFPTGGYVTPTFTIVALALRMADHIKGSFS
jgi:choline dehydrogenase-like flavoprotein